MDLANKRGRIKNFSFSYDEITTYYIIDVYEKPQELNFPKKMLIIFGIEIKNLIII